MPNPVLPSQPRVVRGIKAVIRRPFRTLGYDLLRHEDSISERRASLLRACVVLVEVGANEGNFSHQVRTGGFDGRIVSFEPLSEPFRELTRRAAQDARLEVEQVAVGAQEEQRQMNVAHWTIASSLLPIHERHVTTSPNSAYVGSEEVAVKTLDALMADRLAENEHVYLKLDAQGFELEVLRGAVETLERTVAVETELTVVPVYVGQSLLSDICVHLSDADFGLARIESLFKDRRTQEHLQVDGLFVRRS